MVFCNSLQTCTVTMRQYIRTVYKNITIPTSVLSKKMHGISYHFCREAVASGTCRVAKEDTLTNLADLFTKVLGRVKRESLMDRFMY